MKKFISILIAFIMCMSAVAASAAEIPDFLYDIPLNYSFSAELSANFTNPDDLISLLKKYEMYDDISTYIDIKELLSSNSLVKQEVFFDISEDFKTIALGVKGKSESKITFNKNLNTNINVSNECYIKADIAKRELNVIYTQIPYNKYVVVDITELIDEVTKEMIFANLEMFLTKDNIKNVVKNIVDIIGENSKISYSGNKCSIKINNDQFKSIIKAAIKNISGTIESITNEKIDDVDTIYSTIDEINFLGNKGINVEYKLSNKKVSTVACDADISISLSEKMCENLNFDSDFKFNFSIKESYKYTGYGKTKVDFPVLTDENSISYIELYPSKAADYEYEYTPVYPSYYAYAMTGTLPEENGKYYVPLRMIMESAYRDAIEISYDDGKITLKSDYFTDFKEVKMSIDKNSAYIDGVKKEIAPLRSIDHVTYISTETISELFGWEIKTINHDMLNNVYTVRFATK